MSNTKALATQNGNTALAEQVQKTAVDPEIIALASAFFTAGEMTKEQAVKAAYYFFNTGHVEGRDAYIGTTGSVRGKVLEGYRGIQSGINRDYEVRYRQPNNAEIEEHGINLKGKALVCEVYVLDIWQRKQQMGLPYEPITGIAYYPPGVKINVPATKTEHWVLQKNARKDALRQVPGVPLDADEVLEEAAAAGIRVEVPEGAQLSPEQARLMIAQAVEDQQREELSYEQQQERLQANVNRMRGPEWTAFDEAADGEYRIEVLDADGYDADADFDSLPTHERSAHAEPTTNSDALPFKMTVSAAVAWAQQYAPQVWPTDKNGVILADVVERSFSNLQEQGLSGDDLAHAWIAKVEDKVTTRERTQAAAEA